MTINYIGQKVVVSVSLDELARNPEQVIAALASRGFGVTTSVHARAYFEKFIHACMKMALPMYLVAESMGMVEGEAAFCMVICRLPGGSPVLITLFLINRFFQAFACQGR